MKKLIIITILLSMTAFVGCGELDNKSLNKEFSGRVVTIGDIKDGREADITIEDSNGNKMTLRIFNDDYNAYKDITDSNVKIYYNKYYKVEKIEFINMEG